jgi:transcriptional regulator with XRE-family HTH domain
MTIKRQQRKAERTPKEQARIEAIRKKYQQEKPGPEQLVASGEYEGPVQAGAFWEVRRVMAALKAERERQGLSLAQLAKRAGLDKGAISKLETGVQVNPTLDTLSRLAAGLGVRLGLLLRPEKATDGEKGIREDSPAEPVLHQDAGETASLCSATTDARQEMSSHEEMVVDVVVKVKVADRSMTYRASESRLEEEAVGVITEALQKEAALDVQDVSLLAFDHCKWVFEGGMPVECGLAEPVLLFSDGSWCYPAKGRPRQRGKDFDSLLHFVHDQRGS